VNVPATADAGMGFAVAGGELRNLAQHAAQAAPDGDFPVGEVGNPPQPLRKKAQAAARSSTAAGPDV
jgi:hypothetical protein